MYIVYVYMDFFYNDIRLNEFYMFDVENNILYFKGYYLECIEVRFKMIFDFKFVYVYEVWLKLDGSCILVNYVRICCFWIYDLSV